MPNTTEKYKYSAAEQAELIQEFAQDAGVWNAYLTDKNVNTSPLSNKKKAICKRLVLALSQGTVWYKNAMEDDYAKMADVNETLPDNLKLSYSTLLSRGARVIFEIPPLRSKQEIPSQFLNWLIGENAISTSPKKGEAENKPVFTRSVATHSYTRKQKGREHSLKAFNPKHLFRFFSDYINKRHMAINLGLGTVKEAGKENGENGCIYLYWKPPTLTKPGILMCGVEGSAPGKRDRYGHFHGPLATSPEVSPTGTRKYRHDIFKHYPMRPNKKGGVKIMLENVATVTALSEKNFDLQLLAAPIGKKILREHINTPKIERRNTVIDKLSNVISELKTKLNKSFNREDKSQINFKRK